MGGVWGIVGEQQVVEGHFYYGDLVVGVIAVGGGGVVGRNLSVEGGGSSIGGSVGFMPDVKSQPEEDS